MRGGSVEQTLLLAFTRAKEAGCVARVVAGSEGSVERVGSSPLHGSFLPQRLPSPHRRRLRALHYLNEGNGMRWV